MSWAKDPECWQKPSFALRLECLGCYHIFITSPMVKKMLKAFINVTADKTHFAIDIKNLTIFVYHFTLRYNPPEYNNISYATSSLLNLLQ